MKKCNRIISNLAFPIDYSIILINLPTTSSDRHGVIPMLINTSYSDYGLQTLH